ncbi:MAG: hypothetical protein WKF79_00005 [Nocardioides sp.]
MTDLFDPETVARVTQPTSREAYDRAKPRIPRTQAGILRVLTQHGPKTADEAGALIGVHPRSARPTCTQMSKKNMIADTGLRRRNESGARAIVWRALPEHEWAKPPARLTSAERAEILKARVAYLEHLLVKEGVAFDPPGRPL